MLLMLSLTISFILLWLNHPLSMGITIILQTIVIALISGLSLGSFWFSYIIVITMLSGMLVLFIYMASVASNEKFYTSTKLITTTMILLAISLLMYLLTKNYDNELMKINMNLSTETISLNTLFNTKYKFITMMMVLYLFFTMVVVSFIVNISEGPLRINKK
uniref:NADH dehydrogenase subunit 6 n=1 Tax=Clavigralla tomentosicollis TaxID=1295332 RepID=A0A3G1ICI2_9HEMI|nr:NADH dehydrogenase subunit 6 [Clavigralla tomentosicollis]